MSNEHGVGVEKIERKPDKAALLRAFLALGQKAYLQLADERGYGFGDEGIDASGHLLTELQTPMEGHEPSIIHDDWTKKAVKGEYFELERILPGLSPEDQQRAKDIEAKLRAIAEGNKE